MREHYEAARPRIERDTRTHRMMDAHLRLVGPDGSPLAGAIAICTQERGPLRFGANAFAVGCLGDRQAHWESLFADVFDEAVVPFYWDGVEPVRGRPRFTTDSPPIHRRPPPDAVVDFCRRHDLQPKGHTLAYAQFNPDWLPSDPQACAAAFERWFEQVGERYRGSIPVWDVVNEALTRYGWTTADKPMPPDYIRWAFAAAARLLPGAHRILNEDTASWSQRGGCHFGYEMQPFSLLVENLLAKGVGIDGLGLQFHLKDADEADLWKRASGAQDQPRMLEPPQLLRILDHYAGFGLPLHISEITIPCYGHDEDSEALQAEIAEMLYRTWFSHPSVASIIWWNTVDGLAHGAENRFNGGLLGGDLRQKTVYRVLRRLIREEWRTRVEIACDDSGICALAGFRGCYRIEVRHRDRLLSGSFTLDAFGSEAPITIACR
jgi:GH35 family endo-1,4-beta-xylanase